MSHALYFMSGEEKGKRIPVEEGRALTIGRSPTNDICVPDSKVSRIHCQIELVDDTCILVDLNSTNGTFVNGKRVGVEGVELHEGDEIKIGLTHLRFERKRRDKRKEVEDVIEGDLDLQPNVEFCAECGASITQVEIESGRAKRIGDRLYCPQCSVDIADIEDVEVVATAEEGGVEIEAAVETNESEDKGPGPVAADESGETQDEFVGRTLGNFRIDKKIADGGLGRLYKAYQTTMDRDAALRILHSEFSTNQEWLTRFLEQVDLSAQLVHPNIVVIYSVGQDADVCYIAMEYVNGENLDALLRRKKTLTVRAAVAIGVQLAKAVDHAYEHNVIHRDLTPGSILLDRSSAVKVSNYGITGLLGETEFRGLRRRYAHSRAVFYWSPEHLSAGKLIDVRSDIYSVAAVIFHMVTGRPPLMARTLKDVFQRILHRKPKPANHYNPEAPETLAQILDRALAKDPDERYQVPRQFLWDLEEVANNLGETG